MASLSAGSVASAAPAAVQPHPWDRRIKCRAKDPQGRKIVTRYGNADFGWQHFTGRHNIKKCGTIAAVVKEHPETDDHHGRLTYGGVAFETGVPRPRMVKIVVIVQYSRKTKDGKYDAGSGQTIGVINAFCKNQPGNKCPAWAKL
ncbi:hypothetical protein Shyhy01_49470 [Streptomyces hygroscopicus subsp. hygroscopicus]|nr:hypothetical protein Shyhy01_49470 [Streptomyces hygroscopicus subsp. hygroscopicus]